MLVIDFFRTMEVIFDVLTEYLALDTIATFLMFCLSGFHPPEVSYRHWLLVAGGMAFVLCKKERLYVLRRKQGRNCFLQLCRYSSATLSCCCLSRHTSVFRGVRSSVVFVNISRRWAAKFFSVVPVVWFFSGCSGCVSLFNVFDDFHTDILCRINCWDFEYGRFFIGIRIDLPFFNCSYLLFWSV